MTQPGAGQIPGLTHHCEHADAAVDRIDRIRDAARLHRQQLITTNELYAVIEPFHPQDHQPEADQ